ncbi:phospholipase [Streptomyces solincola]|uniref:Phospholipase n=1 Tax=Streptomyces solincola TaxID=2100817 RepID=A0A2S9PRW9_9ACTN|nr:phospholipase [Streptomyces solincola]
MPTPHLDAVEATLRQVSPGLEGTVWQRTRGNALDTRGDGPAGWLLQTPGCWGDPRCRDRSDTRRLLARIESTVASATSTVDISTLVPPFPDGEFQDALVAGLRAAVGQGRTLRVRVLAGTNPVSLLTVSPSSYRDELLERLGSAAERVTLQVAAMTSSLEALSWNHSKLLVVDGARVLTGGVNYWSGDYVDTGHPVSDVDLALAGPAASSGTHFLDRLWKWTCANIGLRVRFASSAGTRCLPEMARYNPPVPAAGDLSVIGVGGLGVGIQQRDPASTYQPVLPDADRARCLFNIRPDYTNSDRDYETVNPEEPALRELVRTATRNVVISQQDLNGQCPPLPRYDIRLLQTLAQKLVAGVKVRIVVSDPLTRASGYSTIFSLSELSNPLRGEVARLTGSASRARTVMCRNLQLASLRVSPARTWADGRGYALHHKVVSVDDSAFYIGSKNLYPAWLQDYGYMVEDASAAGQLDSELLAPEWQYSQAAATYDYARGVCPAS